MTGAFKQSVAVVCFTALVVTTACSKFERPFALTAGGEVIETGQGHASPFIADFNGDGSRDLLVGQFEGGRLRVYRNMGTDAESRFEDFEYVRAGNTFASVPMS